MTPCPRFKLSIMLVACGFTAACGTPDRSHAKREADTHFAGKPPPVKTDAEPPRAEPKEPSQPPPVPAAPGLAPVTSSPEPTSDSLKLPYSEAEEEAVHEALWDFGDLYIADTDGEWVTHSARQLPWASYWFPYRDDVLFRDGDQSPLGKFDRLVEALNPGRRSTSQALERKRHENSSGFFESSDGLCHAWALAASFVPEPIGPSHDTLHHPAAPEITFSRAELKAILIKAYENATPDKAAVTQYGRRFYGRHKTDGQYQDLRPEAFHRISEVMLGERGRAFAVDTHADPLVWTHPLYKMAYNVSVDPDREDAFIVKGQFTYINYRQVVSSEPTDSFTDIMTHDYSYRLHVDRSQMKDGKYKVTYGEWIGKSLDHHPDFVVVPSETMLPVPANEELARNIDILQELLEKGEES